MDIYRKLKYILSRRQKKKIGKLIVLMFFGSLLETISVAAILPFISLILEPELLTQNRYYQFVYQLPHFKSTSSFLIWLGVILIFAYIIKNVYLLFLYKQQFNFIYDGQLQMSKRLMQIYMKQPYSFFLTGSSADVIRTVKYDCNYTFILLRNGLQAMTESLVAVVIAIFLLWIDVKMTTFVCVLLLVTILVVKKIFQPILSQAGAAAQQADGGMNRWISQSIHGIKEVKVSQCEDFFVTRFYTEGKNYAEMQKKSNILELIPRFSIETVGVVGLLFYLVLVIANGSDIVGTIPRISAVAMAAIRLMPSANRINNSLSQISYCRASLDTIHSILTEAEKQKNSKMRQTEIPLPFEKEASMIGIEYHYPDTDMSILKNVEIRIPKGTSVGIIGKSGSGKTTLVNVLLGLLEPQSGGLYIDDTLITGENYYSWLNKVAYIPQDIFLLEGSILENVIFGEETELADRELVQQVLEEAQLKEFVEMLPAGIETQIGERGIRLSGGQRQRLGIARALYRSPDFFVFDEATSSLDHETEKEVMEAINHLHGKKTLIIIAHRLNTIEQCDLVYKVEENTVERCTEAVQNGGEHH